MPFWSHSIKVWSGHLVNGGVIPNVLHAVDGPTSFRDAPLFLWVAQTTLGSYQMSSLKVECPSGISYDNLSKFPSQPWSSSW